MCILSISSNRYLCHLNMPFTVWHLFLCAHDALLCDRFVCTKINSNASLTKEPIFSVVCTQSSIGFAYTQKICSSIVPSTDQFRLVSLVFNLSAKLFFFLTFHLPRLSFHLNIRLFFVFTKTLITNLLTRYHRPYRSAQYKKK